MSEKYACGREEKVYTVTMAKDDFLNIEESRVMYNSQGEPEFMLVPFKRTSVYPVRDSEIVAAVDSLRTELMKQYNAETTEAAA